MDAERQSWDLQQAQRQPAEAWPVDDTAGTAGARYYE